MTFSVSLEWWQITIVVLYFFIGLLVCLMAIFANGLQQGMGSAFGYPEHRLKFWSLLFIVFLWPLVVLAVVGLLVDSGVKR